jgi:hypothetical protein
LAANFPNLFTADYADSADKKNGQDPDVAQELTEETETQHATTGDPPRAERTAHLCDPPAAERLASGLVARPRSRKLKARIPVFDK